MNLLTDNVLLIIEITDRRIKKDCKVKIVLGEVTAFFADNFYLPYSLCFRMG